MSCSYTLPNILVPNCSYKKEERITGTFSLQLINLSIEEAGIPQSVSLGQAVKIQEVLARIPGGTIKRFHSLTPVRVRVILSWTLPIWCLK